MFSFSGSSPLNVIGASCHCGNSKAPKHFQTLPRNAATPSAENYWACVSSLPFAIARKRRGLSSASCSGEERLLCVSLNYVIRAISYRKELKLWKLKSVYLAEVLLQASVSLPPTPTPFPPSLSHTYTYTHSMVLKSESKVDSNPCEAGSSWGEKEGLIKITSYHQQIWNITSHYLQLVYVYIFFWQVPLTVILLDVRWECLWLVWVTIFYDLLICHIFSHSFICSFTIYRHHSILITIHNQIGIFLIS